MKKRSRKMMNKRRKLVQVVTVGVVIGSLLIVPLNVGGLSNVAEATTTKVSANVVSAQKAATKKVNALAFLSKGRKEAYAKAFKERYTVKSVDTTLKNAINEDGKAATSKRATNSKKINALKFLSQSRKQAYVKALDQRLSPKSVDTTTNNAINEDEKLAVAKREEATRKVDNLKFMSASRKKAYAAAFLKRYQPQTIQTTLNNAVAEDKKAETDAKNNSVKVVQSFKYMSQKRKNEYIKALKERQSLATLTNTTNNAKKEEAKLVEANKEVKVTVNVVLKDTAGRSLGSSQEQAVLGQNYTSKAPTIDGYTVKSTPTAKVAKDGQIFAIIYQEVKYQLTINIKDRVSGKVLIATKKEVPRGWANIYFSELGIDTSGYLLQDSDLKSVNVTQNTSIEFVVDKKMSQQELATFQTKTATKLIALINQYRQESERNVWTISPGLTSAAAIRGKEVSQDFSHSRPNGGTLGELIRFYGEVPTNQTIENLAQTYNGNNADDAAQTILEAWQDSLGHNQNLLSLGSKAGVGIYADYDANGNLVIFTALLAV